MTIKEQIERDLKTAMLSGDRLQIDTLRSLKSAILYAEVEGGRSRNLDENATTRLLAKEAKKRQESADIYLQAHEEERGQKELSEKLIIERYLPAQLSEDAIKDLVGQAYQELESSDQLSMGVLIGRVKEKAGGSADGATIARLVKERLES